MTVLWSLLSPPVLEPSRELEWVLRRAFGPARGAATAGEVAEALRLARLLGVRERIAARVGEAALSAEIGSEAARGLMMALRGSAVRGMTLLALARTVAGVAAECGIPLVFSKFLALHASGTVVVGARPATDIDVVVPQSRIQELQQALVAAGMVPQSGVSPAGHLVPLNGPAGGTVELHWALRGVRVRRKRFATVEDLVEEGLLVRAGGYPGSCWLPVVEVRLAHLLVHAFRQHGWSNEFYPLLRALADLQDAAEGRWEEARRSWLPAVQRLLRGPLNAAWSDAVFELGRRLDSGERSLLLEASSTDGPPETVVLRHVVAKSLDRTYARRIRFLGHFPLSERPLSVATGAIRRLVSPVPGTIEVSRGVGRSRAARAAWLLARPFQLFHRYGRFLALWGRSAERQDGGIGLTQPRQEAENPHCLANVRVSGRRDGEEEYSGPNGRGTGPL